MGQAKSTRTARAPLRVLVYSEPKIGKSTFAAQAPKPFFISGDRGLGHIDAMAVFPETWADTLQTMVEFAKGDHEWKTLVVDPLNFFEAKIVDHVCAVGNKKNIEEFGFGKGWAMVDREWVLFYNLLEKVYRSGRNFILLTHSKTAKKPNPEGEAWDCYQPELRPNVAKILLGCVDAFMHADLLQVGVKQGNVVRGYSNGERVLHTVGTSTRTAGNRFELPEQIPLSWRHFAIYAAQTVDEIRPLFLETGTEEAAFDKAATEYDLETLRNIYIDKIEAS